MIKEITPRGNLRSRVHVPGSKSTTNRALICASLAKGESLIRNASDSEDTSLMANGLNQLGVLVRKNGDALIVTGTGGRLYAPKFPIPVGNAGTTLRFLISLAALAQGNVAFEGSRRMAERPINDLLDALRMLGVEAKVQESLSLYNVQGGSLPGGIARLSGEKSSQFISSLLMVSPYSERDVTIEVEGDLASRPYVDITMDVMLRFGAHVQHADYRRFNVAAGQRYAPGEFDVEPDASGASYFLAAAAICGGEIMVEGLRSNSLQGDVHFLRVLQQMGCDVSEDGDGVRLRSTGRLEGVEIDMNAMPDVVPTLAVTALFGRGVTRILNVGHLRHKESDRLGALATELRKLGACVTVLGDDLEIEPAQLRGALLDTYDDHRLAMSFALAGLRVPGVKIENPDCVKKSFPTFWKEFEKLHEVP